MILLATGLSQKKLKEAFGTRAIGKPVMKRRCTLYLYEGNIDDFPRGMLYCADVVVNSERRVVKNRYF